MILSSEVATQDAEQMLQFYKQNFAVVEVVSCDRCGNLLAFECSGGDSMGLPQNELGKYIIPIGDNLLSHRVRLDEAPTGERMVGYQCGFPVQNPDYQIAVQKYKDAYAEWEKHQAQRVLDAQKEFKKAVAFAKKNKIPEPVWEDYEPPVHPPIMENVPETIPCGNDTRIADVERGLVPIGRQQTSLSPFEKHQLRQKIAAKKHKVDFRKVGNIKHFESFQVERV